MVGPSNALFTLHGGGLPDDRQVFAYRAREAVSELFSIDVDFATEEDSFDLKALLKERLALEVTDERGRSRIFDGIVGGARFLSVVGTRGLQFRVTLVPALSLLCLREDCRIFQDKSVPDIVRELLEEADLAKDVKFELSESYEPREFTVQYCETTFNFISRLLEDEGIYYFFVHTPEGHHLVFGDRPAVFEDHEGHFEDTEPVTFGLTQSADISYEPVERFRRRRALRTTSVQLRDFEFKTPRVPPEATRDAHDAWPLPYYEYGAGFSKNANGVRKATARLSELRGDADTASGESSALGLRVGGVFHVEGGAEEISAGSFALLELETSGSQQGSSAEENYAAKNSFRGLPLGSPYAPPKRAQKPRILGHQTAVVTGRDQEDQSIHVDEFGRIKVHFYWDRLGPLDDQSSCWIRVNQVPLGGSMILPRLGWEVSVVFLGGDPDRPLVVGRVYNAELTPPMALPAAKASTSLKSMSSPGAAGSNEITMGDSGGSQGFAIKAQKDLNIQVNYDSTTEIKVDDEHSIQKNLSRSVAVDDSLTVSANQKVTVGANLSTKVGASHSVSVGANDTSNATANFVEKVGGNRSYTVGANATTISNGNQSKITGDVTRTVGAAELVVSAQGISDNIIGNSTASVGAARIHLTHGTHGEVVAQMRSQTVAAAELHMVSGSYRIDCEGAASTLVGAVCMQKVKGDIKVSAPMISLLGAVGQFKGGSSELKLSGGPLTIKGSKISVKGALIKKTGASLKIG